MLGSLYMRVIGVLVVGLVIYFGYRYVTNLQQEAAQWQSKAVALELIVESKEAALAALREGVERQRELHTELEEKLSAARTQIDSVTKVFSNHDFGKLLSAKPGLIHTRMRAGTKRVFQQFEEASRGN